MVCLFLCFKNIFKKIKIFYFFSLLQINIFLVFLDHFDTLITKIIFKNKKIYYFDTFLNEKHFKK
jgi:hypothetical protein